MPETGYWESLFNVPLILDRMGVDASMRDLVEFGCGYGTFTLPAARRIAGTLHALDMDDEVLGMARDRAAAAGINNIGFQRRDFLAEGTGLSDASVDYVMLFNILHHERPLEMAREALRILKPGGRVGAIHWIWSAQTPRGPALDIRPKPEAMMSLLSESGFRLVTDPPIELPPWHFGVLGRR